MFVIIDDNFYLHNKIIYANFVFQDENTIIILFIWLELW